MWKLVKNKLRFAPLKTNSMMLTKKLKHDDPVVHINGEQISLVSEIRRLDLSIDQKLTFTPYVAKVCKKAANIYKVSNPGHRFDSDSVPTLVFNPSPVLYCPTGLASVSNSDPVLDSASHLSFNCDSTIGYSSDLNEAMRKC
ncbi:hypothetical protein EVAR_62913_1 [Eumeta japonica]|uniref:Uncharacterized protein n=1 Tax=Eumeta variegata TaxID=151549 RepID=A0A4C1YAX5_EUMVA|nr:hypothetical protein EVAR_62913_1 [Eumeta japonica]